MIEQEHRGAHWRGTRANALLAIGLLALVLGFASLLAGLFLDWSFLGFPFQFYFAAQGAFILMVIIVFWSSGAQENTDRRHGASEEI